ncbi:hypothetical protein FACS1894199_09770 [Bacteroidia bacterium]|nr:hypothetical protein FACS1894199_09770 [Bacteroidia bacterium]
MILSKLENSSRIEVLHPRFKQLFDYVKKNDLLHKELGKIVLDGDELFLTNAEYDGKKKEDQDLEVHRKYIDVHFLFEGKETFGWKALEDLQTVTQPYDDQKDMALYGDKPTTYVNIQPGEFVVVFPEDPHAPNIGEGKIRKAIAKIKYYK